MSKTYNMLAASFTEIIDNLENNNGTNLHKTVLTLAADKVQTITPTERQPKEIDSVIS